MTEKPVVLITGVSSGIGMETANLLKAKGFQVIGTSRNPEKCRELPFPVIPLDITSEESIDACVHWIDKEVGRIDALICNAGIMGPVAAGEELTTSALMEVFQTNFFGTINLIRAIIPCMKKQKGGRVIVVSSIAGKVGAPPFFSAYSASKHALEGYIETVAKELASFQIRITLIEPGYFRTSIHKFIQNPPYPISDYERRRIYTYALQNYAIEHGRHPQQVAHAILSTLLNLDPPLRELVGLDAKFLDAGRRYLPERIFQDLLSHMFNWKKETQNPVTPVRKILLNSQIADRSWRILSAGFIVFVLLKILRFIFIKKGR